MEQVVESAGSPPAWVMDPRLHDNSAGDRESPAISAQFFLGPDPRGNEIGETIVDETGSVPTIEMVEITNRNDPKNVLVFVSTDFHRYKRRSEGGFPEEYQRFKQGLDMQATGTPIKDWLGDNSRTANLASFNIHTIEQLCAVSDGLCQTLGPGTYDLRRKAQAYLDHKRNSGAAEQALAQNAALHQEMAEMRKQLALLTASSQQAAVTAPEQHIELTASEELPPPPARRPPGRPRVNQGE